MSQPDLRAYETLDDEPLTASSKLTAGPKRFKAGPVSKGGQPFKSQSAQEIAKEKREQEKRARMDAESDDLFEEVDGDFEEVVEEEEDDEEEMI